MKNYTELTKEQQEKVISSLRDVHGMSYSTYYTLEGHRHDAGMSFKNGMGFLLNDLIVDSEWHQ